MDPVIESYKKKESEYDTAVKNSTSLQNNIDELQQIQQQQTTIQRLQK